MTIEAQVVIDETKTRVERRRLGERVFLTYRIRFVDTVARTTVYETAEREDMFVADRRLVREAFEQKITEADAERRLGAPPPEAPDLAEVNALRVTVEE